MTAERWRFTFIDEHPDSINNGYFLNRIDQLEWIDLPASYHDGAATVTFADGHIETHRWLFSQTKPLFSSVRRCEATCAERGPVR